MNSVAAPPVTVTDAPAPADNPVTNWERDALRKLRLLRQGKKPAILFMTPEGALQIFRGEMAGVVAP